MRLRTVVQRPNRYEEEYDSSTKQIMPSRLNNVNKSTIPTYPDLLLSRATSEHQELRPAAFPSLPLKRKRDSSVQLQEGRDESRHKDGGLSRYPTASRTHDGGLHQEKSLPKRNARTDSLEEVVVEFNGHLQQKSESSALARGFSTLPDLRMNSKVYWNNISPGLQLYILDSLLPQFLLPEFIAEVLGLNADELARLVALKKQRMLQPETTEELWNYCRSIGDGPNSFVDPAVMRRYLDYFAFVAQFESTSIVERQAAIVFLRQRRIEGAFVEALLPDRPGVWTRPQHKKPRHLHSAAQLSTFTEDDEAEWLSMLSKTLVHESHDLDMLTGYFKSNYFPKSICQTLLATPLGNLDTFDTWLLYGIVSPGNERAESIGRNPAQLHPKPVKESVRMPHDSPDRLNTHAEEEARELAIHEAQSQRIYRMLYKITRGARLLRLMSQRSHQLPLSGAQNAILYDLAREHLRVEHYNKATNLVLEYGTDDIGKPSDVAANLSSREIEDVHPSTTMPTSSRPLFQLQGDATEMTQQANATPTAIASTASLHRRSRSSDRASSEQSYHTAQDNENNPGFDVKRQQYSGRSPSPPPWSPITDGGIEGHDVDNLPSEVAFQAIEKPDHGQEESIIHQPDAVRKRDTTVSPELSAIHESVRNTIRTETKEVTPESPLSESAKSHKSPSVVSTRPGPMWSTSSPSGAAATKDDQSKSPPQQGTLDRVTPNELASRLLSPPRSQLLSGINEAAKSISPPSIFVNVDPKSLDASRGHDDKKNLQKPTPSTSKKKTTDHSNPPKSGKGQRNPSSHIDAEAEPKNQTKKPALKVQVPKILSSSSSSTAASPVKRQYKTRSDKGKKRGPYGKRNSSVSPTKPTTGTETPAKESKRFKTVK